jgi:C-terminal processing protease CtpA/Prc
MKFLLASILPFAMALPVFANPGVLQGLVEYSPGTGKIGVRVSPSGKVMRVSPRSPAAKVGIMCGDKIIAADGKPGAVGRIHGTPGTTVDLTVKRGEQEFNYEVERVNEHLLIPYDGNPDVAETGNTD